ncbi:MAG: polymer-forming cytoskeletal protein [Steroidobacteraceae bacterium]
MPSNSSNENVSVLGPTLRFKGELHADEDLQIHGHVEGTITHTKYLTVGRDGHVKADIQGHIIAVQGTVEGDLTAETSVAITDTGHLTGDIRAPSISINDGADVNGKVTMETVKTSRPTPSHRKGALVGATDCTRHTGEQ